MKNLITILCLCLFWGSCENPTETKSNEVDVDWVLVKTPDYYDETYGNEGVEIIEGVGYYFYYTNSSNIVDLNMEEFDSELGSDYVIFNDGSNGILSFSYNDEIFSFNLSDSYDSLIEKYRIETLELTETLQRIIYNKVMNYFTIFGADGFFGIELNSSSPNELIDYR